jgi:CheY-like chemotaxis protein
MRGSEINKVDDAVSAGVPGRTVSPQRILVVDDNNSLRRLCVDVLVTAGYEVTAAVDGAAGWAELQFNQYDLIITDNQMPKMTGLQMMEKMRSARMTLPVIMATGCLPTLMFTRQPWLQPDATLERPFSNEDLLETVTRVLKRDEDYNAHILARLPHPPGEL